MKRKYRILQRYQYGKGVGMRYVPQYRFFGIWRNILYKTDFYYSCETLEEAIRVIKTDETERSNKKLRIIHNYPLTGE